MKAKAPTLLTEEQWKERKTVSNLLVMLLLI